jgi:ubiquinone/menaquinone biosynthesis C-methylase UbiE
MAEPPLVVDIGGEGRHPTAWNLNPRRHGTLGSKRRQPIPRLIVGRADAIPLADGIVDRIIVERTPLSQAALGEIRRVLSPSGSIVLRHVVRPGTDRHARAVATLAGEVVRRTYRAFGQLLQETEIQLTER